MLNPKVQAQLGELEKLLRNETLTPSRKVDCDSVVCLVETLGNMPVGYLQFHVGKLPANDQLALLDNTKGDVIGNHKIIGIFDIWL